MQNNLIKRIDSPFDIFEEFFGSALRPSMFSTPQWSGGCAAYAPQVDVQETDDAIVISAALPGVKKENIEIEVKDGRLILTGSASGEAEAEDNKSGWVRREIVAGRFYRAFQLPSGMQSDKIEAKHNDGVLEIRIPKAESAKARSIEIR